MSTFKRFEDIDAWRQARVLSKRIHSITKDRAFIKEPDLKRQMKRCAGSILDNIAEGFERGGNKEFIHFLSISKGSAGEIRSQLYRSLDYELIDQEKFDELYPIAEGISKMLEGLISYLKTSEFKGTKFTK